MLGVSKHWVSVVFFLCSKFCFAYAFTEDFNSGFYWGSFPINFTKYAVSSSEGSLLTDLSVQAENAWEDAVGRDIWNQNGSFSTSQNYSGNFIRWSDNFAAETGFDAQSTLAVTIRYRTGTFLDRFEIILNGQNSALRNNIGNMLYQTILHELGHTIGLDHSASSFTVMAASLSGISQLQSDDVTGMNALVDETINRQSIGFVSALASKSDESSSALGCGSIDLNGKSGGGGGPLSLALGILMSLFAFNRKTLPRPS